MLFGRPRAAGKLLDPPLRRVQPSHADAVQLLAAGPELQRLVEPGLAALEPLDDALELLQRLLEGRFLAHGRTSSTVAPNEPAPSSTSTRAPGETPAAEVTSRSPLRTI